MYHQFMIQLLRNPLFTNEIACVLGLWPRLSWVAMDIGPSFTVVDWVNFQQTSVQDQKNRVSNFRGANKMLS